ncbi:F0F1 ATP synthase subunit delta [Gardnerella sp. 2492-Sm]|uniref:F0F1 ATP synthase subunit delta n=1 Tax=unclassified Gardnerella TaxID=2628112 RepID=UPI003CFC257F
MPVKASRVSENLSRTSLSQALSDAHDEAQRIADELSSLIDTLNQYPELSDAMTDPNRSSEDKSRLIDELIGGKAHPVVLRIMHYLVGTWHGGEESGKTGSFGGAWSGFQREAGETLVTVTTAQPLTDKQIKRLIEIYSNKLGHRAYINPIVDPNVLGGMRIQIGDKITDRTMLMQLKQLQRSARNGAWTQEIK